MSGMFKPSDAEVPTYI